MKEQLNRIVNSEFIRNTGNLAIGTTVAQLIPILLQPILRRYYSAEIFGVYGVYISIIGILYCVTSLRYEQAIVLPKNKQDAYNLFFLSQIINIGFCLVLFLFTFLFIDKLLIFLNMPPMARLFIMLLPPGILLFNMYQAISLILLREKQFTTISKSKFVRRGTEGSFQILFRYSNFIYGLVIGDIIGHIVNVFYSLRKAKHHGLSFQQLNTKRMILLAREYKVYPKVNTLSTFMNACSMLLPMLIINKYYGSVNAGYYDLTRLILLTPIALLASSLSNVLLQRVAEKKHAGQSFINEFKLIIGIGLCVAVGEILLIFLVGEPVFTFAFGKEWVASVGISRWLIWPFLIYFFTFSCTAIFLALKQIKLLSIYQVTNFMLVIALVFFTTLPFYSFIKLFTLISITSGSVFFILLFIIINKYNRSASVV